MFNRTGIFGAFLLLFWGAFMLQAQITDDHLLFTVDGKEVLVSEFKHIYNKTNGEKADYSEASLREYLDLYINFKLQVAEGEAIGLDEKPTVRSEQERYKRQLASTYLIDREITEKLVREAYDRSKEDRRISHILIATNEGMTEQALREAYDRAKKVKNEVTAQNFGQLAGQYSDDQYSKSKGGDLGYYTALQLPYSLETAAYTIKKGEVSDIVKTQYGYHIVSVTAVRPAKGSVKVAHILIRNRKDPKGAKKKIDSLYGALMDGAEFEQVAAANSQDNATKNRGGQLGWISINQYAEAFEAQIFALKQDGNISKPFQTKAGWHILKRQQAIQNPRYQDVKTEITNTIKRKPRFELIQDALVEDIKKESDFKENTKIKQMLIDSLKREGTFLTYRWRAPKEDGFSAQPLFTIGKLQGTVREFMVLAQRGQKERFGQPRTVEAAVERILKKLITQKALAYEETQLEKRYPEFKALMREYDEGILLFEVKKELIWDKASSDEEGLKAFFEAHRDDYQWKDRANVTFYTLRTDDKKLIRKIRCKAKRKSTETVKALFNKDREIVQTTTGVYEKGKNAELDQIKWKAGTMSTGETKDGSFYFTKIEEIIPPAQKTLDEARGYIIADYQDNLEQQLIERLKEKFEVKINEEVLKSLIK